MGLLHWMFFGNKNNLQMKAAFSIIGGGCTFFMMLYREVT